MLAHERRSDVLFRNVMDLCQITLERDGYRLVDRGGTEQLHWVQLARDLDDGRPLPPQVRVTHHRGRHWLQVETRPQDPHGPYQRQYYSLPPGAHSPQVAARLAGTICAWVRSQRENAG